MLLPWLHFLKEDDQLLVESPTRRWVVNGPGTFLAPPFHRVKRRHPETLGPTDYLRLRDTLTGEVRNEYGPRLYFLSASEDILLRLTAIPLKTNQYIRLIDKHTGMIRVERGEGRVYLGPTEEILDGVTEGINLDEHTAVLVRDTGSGRLTLVAEPQVFFPAPTQEIVEIRSRLLLEDHDTIIIKDPEGRYLLRQGTQEERSFFLPPYHELVTLYWSSGIHKDHRSLRITHLDTRPKFMWYEFETRTQDNVELILGITFFWQIVDVAEMLHTTDDAPGDICSHARSVIIQSVSQVTLERFLATFNAIVRAPILEQDDPFYTERGVRIHAVEVRSIACKDAGTQRILQEIIQETTNRLNRLQKQESENEVRVKQVRGEIEAEEMRGQLLAVRHEHVRTEAVMAGEAEALKVRMLLEGLGEQLSPTDRLAIFNVLRKQDALEALSQGDATLYFTPADVNLSIETKGS